MMSLKTIIVSSILAGQIALSAPLGASELLPDFIYRSYVKKAETGEVAYQLRLALLNEQGLAPDASSEKALYWYEQAAKNGSVAAMMKAGGLLLQFHRDEKAAVARRYFEDAAKAGNVAAYFNLAVMNETGQGGPRDLDQAIQYYRIAAEAGHVASMKNLALIYWRGENGMLNLLEAEKWLKKASEAGDEVADDLLIRLQKLKNLSQN